MRHPRSPDVPHPTSIEDVAARAGVSTATVSRVLGGRGRVRQALAARVRQAVAALGYVPNPAARSLAAGEGAATVALAIPAEHPSAWIGEVMHEVVRQLDAAGILVRAIAATGAEAAAAPLPRIEFCGNSDLHPCAPCVRIVYRRAGIGVADCVVAPDWAAIADDLAVAIGRSGATRVRIDAGGRRAAELERALRTVGVAVVPRSNAAGSLAADGGPPPARPAALASGVASWGSGGGRGRTGPVPQPGRVPGEDIVTGGGPPLAVVVAPSTVACAVADLVHALQGGDVPPAAWIPGRVVAGVFNDVPRET